MFPSTLFFFPRVFKKIVLLCVVDGIVIGVDVLEPFKTG